jgi:hypothetical protein
MPPPALVPPPSVIAAKVHWIRHEKVILDYDLAALYDVETRVLNQAIKRNRTRFPQDFMFQLTAEEAAVLHGKTGLAEAASPANSSQTVMSSRKHRGHAYLLYAFKH